MSILSMSARVVECVVYGSYDVVVFPNILYDVHLLHIYIWAIQFSCDIRCEPVYNSPAGCYLATINPEGQTDKNHI